MEHSSIPNNLVKLNLLVVPVFTLSGWKDRYELSDFSYGEFIIFRKNKPKYYLNSFDKLYQSAIKDISENKKNIAEFLEEKFNKLDNDLSTKNVLWGLRFDKKEHIEEFCLEKLPLSFLI